MRIAATLFFLLSTAWAQEKPILTPRPGAAPRINGPKVYGQGKRLSTKTLGEAEQLDAARLRMTLTICLPQTNPNIPVDASATADTRTTAAGGSANATALIRG